MIDQKYGYLGGLDLCWGRYDDNTHKIHENTNDSKNYFFPGIDYSNARICDFADVEIFKKESVSRQEVRMPWHDVHTFVSGPCVNDLSRHFVERWNFARTIGNLQFQKDAAIVNSKFFLIVSQGKSFFFFK